MKKLLLSALCAVTALIGSADTATWSFKAGSNTFNADGMTLNMASGASVGTWTFAYVCTSTPQNDGTNGPRFGTSSAPLTQATLSLSDSDIPANATITNVSFTVKGNAGSSQSSWNLLIDNKTIGDAKTSTKGNSASTLTWSDLNVSNSSISFELVSATAGLHLQGVEVTYTRVNEGGETGGDIEEMGEIIATYNETAIASEDEITIKQGEAIEINVANAKSISAQVGEFPATEVDGATLTWKPETIVSEEVATITATAQDGSTKTLEFFLTVTEKTAVDVNDEPWIRVTSQDEIKVGVPYAFVGSDSGTTATVGAYDSSKNYFTLLDVTIATDNTIATMPDAALLFSLESTTTEGQFYITSDGKYISCYKTGNKAYFKADAKDPFTLTSETDGYVTVTAINTEAEATHWGFNPGNTRFCLYKSIPGPTNSNVKEVYMYYQKKNDSTSISEVVAEGEQSGVMFDLQGRRVSAPRKGMIYVQGGKKIRF